jgi:hypothetical protein
VGVGSTPGGGGPPLGVAESVQAKQLEEHATTRDLYRHLNTICRARGYNRPDLIAGVDGLLDAALPAVALAEPGASCY